MAKKKQSLEEHFAMLHEMKPAPFNPSYNPEYVKRCEELEAELKRFCDQEPEPPRCERIRKQAELYSEIYGTDYPSRMAKRYPECFPEGVPSRTPSVVRSSHNGTSPQGVTLFSVTHSATKRS